MKSVAKCPCCPETSRPEGYYEEKIKTLNEEELVWDDRKHLDLRIPSVIRTLDNDLNNDSSIVKQLATNYGCSSAFKVLSSEGSRTLDRVLQGLEPHARSSARIPKLIRGGTFRSSFLNGMGHSPEVLRHVSALAGCEMIYHPMKIHQLHVNLKPPDVKTEGEAQVKKKNVDRWHCDTTPFVLVVFCTSPDEYTGGELQYFNGPREEGMALLSSGAGLPADRIYNVGRQEKGWGVFMQGWRVFHQVSAVLTGDARTTIVFSFHPRNALALEACTHLSQTYAPVDPLHVIMPDWVRFRAWKVMRRLEQLKEELFPDEARQYRKSPDLSVMDLFAALDHSHALLGGIVYTLPYSSDRPCIVSLLRESIAGIRSYLALTYPELMVYEQYGIERARSGSTDEFKPSFTSVAEMTCSPGCETELLVREATKSPPHSEAFLSSPYGLPNLLGAVEDIDNCIQDVLTLRENESQLVYF